MRFRPAILLIVTLVLVLAAAPAWSQVRVTRGGTTGKGSASDDDSKSKSGPSTSSGSGSSGPSRGSGPSSQDSSGSGFRGSSPQMPYRQPQVRIAPPQTIPQPTPSAAPFPWPSSGGSSTNGGGFSGANGNYQDQQQDRRLQALESELLRNQILDAKLRRDLMRPAGGMMPLAPASAAAQGGIFSISFGGGRVREQTADEEAGDGLGDEAIVCVLFGYYDSKRDLFAFLPPLKSQILPQLNKGDPILATAIPEKPFEVYLEPRRHLFIVVPTVWEVDREAEESLDRASRLHDLIVACAADIHTEIRELRHDINGVKPGREIGFPFIGGTTGGNRPIGMRQSGKGVVSFCPSALLIDFKEAQTIARRGSQSIIYKDEPETELGGAYEIKIDVTRVR